MPLGTLDRTPPPFFKQGPSALSKLIVFSALALFLMVADMRFGVADPLRAVVAAMIAPARWLALQPVRLAEGTGDYFQSLSSAQSEQASTRDKLARLAQDLVHLRLGEDAAQDQSGHHGLEGGAEGLHAGLKLAQAVGFAHLTISQGSCPHIDSVPPPVTLAPSATFAI